MLIENKIDEQGFDVLSIEIKEGEQIEFASAHDHIYIQIDEEYVMIPKHNWRAIVTAMYNFELGI